MKYGSSIKIARKSLRASQADIANINISRNLISSIEKGHTNLVPQKGLIIYERLLEISLEKQKLIDFELDGLLSDLPRYNHLKAAYKFCSDLFKVITDEGVIDLEKLETDLEQVNQYDTGLLKFFTYLFSARYYKNYSEEKSYQYYIEALEFLKWHYPLQKESLFSMTFNEATPLGYALKQYDTLSYYLNQSLQLKTDLNIEFNVNHYYNLALFYNSNEDYKEAIGAANKYISLAEEIATNDLVDALIIKAIGYSSLNQSSDCILLHEECIRMTKNTQFYTQYALSLSNAIYCISYHKLDSHKQDIEGYEKELLQVLEKEIYDTVSFSNIYSNIGTGQAFLENHALAYEYFSKALTIIDNEKAMSHEVSLLKECLQTFTVLKKIDEYIDFVTQVQVNELDDREKGKFIKLLLRIHLLKSDSPLLNDYIENQILS